MTQTESQIAEIVRLFAERGDSQYGGEAVTQREHALQAAALAEAEGASAELISAALLHDVGHLLHELPEDAPDQGVDDRHENSGWRRLAAIFPDAVTEPVRLHVAAKRYLCTVEPAYQQTLSKPSLVSFRLQGGAMSAEEVADFEANPHYQAAVRLRRWDDAAKVPQLPTPGIEHFATYLLTSSIW